MAPPCSLVVNVDSDPDPASEWQSDAAILAKYQVMRAVLEACGARGAWCVLTGPICRTRFLEPPFTEFWGALREAGGDLVMHAEEDLYGPPPGKVEGRCSYLDAAHMREVIGVTAARMREAGLAFDAYRGGYHGLTPAIAAAALDAGMSIDLSCAPGIVWPERAASWEGAPLTAYRMDPARPGHAAPGGALLEIPFAWDGVEAGVSRPFVIGANYMVNEFSTLEAMRAVWDAVQARAASSGEPQTVSMITHTFAIDRPECRDRLAGLLDYVGETGGRFTTPREVRGVTVWGGVG